MADTTATLAVDPPVVLAAIDSGCIIDAQSIHDPAHSPACCGCLVARDGSRVVCNECGHVFNQ